MHRVILAHVPGDEAVAQRWATLAGGVSVCVRNEKSSVHVGAGAVLGVVWSARASASPCAPRLMAIAAESRSAVLFQADDAALPEALAALRLVSIAPNAGGEEVSATLRLAQRMQPRRPVGAYVRRDSAAPQLASVAMAAEEQRTPSYSRMFVSGMTRGFASSVAVISLGAGAAVGVQEKAGAFVTDSVAHPLDHIAQAGLTDDQAETLAHAMPGIVSDVELAHQASALRQAAAAQREQIFERLNGAEQQIADARVRTDAMIARLDAISSSVDAASFAAAAPSGMAVIAPHADPAPVQQAAAPSAAPAAPPPSVQAEAAPSEDVYALTRYADRVAAESAASIAPIAAEDDAKLGLWSPI